MSLRAWIANLVFALLPAVVAGAAPAPLLGWTDAAPAIEVRPLSGPITVGIRYGVLDPATFHAELDGERVSDLFHPEAGAEETVALPFIAGRNRLRLMASSPDGLEHLTIERSIAFARVPGDENSPERLRSLPELRHEIWKRETPEAPGVAAPAVVPRSAPVEAPVPPPPG